jgi:hypothetical protein
MNTEFIKKNFVNIVVVVLLAVILLQTCKKQSVEVTGPTIIRDTTWIIKDSTVYSKPQVVKTITVPIEQWSTEYLPDTNYSKLVKQYTELAEKFLASNIHADSVKIDSIGYVHITDTVSRNLLIGRSTYYNLKYPIIKETIILPEKKRNQLYVGGLLQGNVAVMPSQISVGGLFKTKKDQIYGATIGIDRNGQIQYGAQIYWKIKLK